MIIKDSGRPICAAQIERRREMRVEKAPVVEPGQSIDDPEFEGGRHVVAQRVGVVLAAQLRAHARDEFIAVDRPQNVVVHAKIETAQDARSLLGIGEQQNGQSAGSLQRTQLAA